jgi:WD repeat-containing protein 68
MSHIQPSSSHSYSRSSPAGLQEHQKYVPFAGSSASNTPGSDMQGMPPQPRYPQTPQQKYYAPGTPSAGGVAQSPLVLEQIRPRANSSLNDDSNMFGDMQSTNSNYMAPWAVFAFDWCKYPMLNSNSAGKMAIGSYLEDPHNFVRVNRSSTLC